MKDGTFDMDRVLNGWLEKLEQALARGFEGLRLTGNTAWLEKGDWQDFTDYEEAVNSVIGKHRMMALCTYSLDKCSAAGDPRRHPQSPIRAHPQRKGMGPDRGFLT